MKRNRALIVLAGLMLLVPGASRAQSSYTIQVIVKGGDQDQAGDFVVGSCGGNCFDLVGLNDAGEVSLLAPGSASQPSQPALLDYGSGGLIPAVETGDFVGDTEIASLESGASGPSQNGYTVFMGRDGSGAPALAQYANGNVTEIAAVGGPAPGGGTWVFLSEPASYSRLSMNDRGEVVFSGRALAAGAPVSKASFGTFRWDPQTQKITPVAVTGMQLGAHLTLDGSGLVSPAINNRGQVLFEAFGKDDAGNSVDGLFLLDQNQNPQTVALKGQSLPGGDQIRYIFNAVLNDTGVVAFWGLRQSDGKQAVYQWANGAITPTGVVVGGDAPGGGKFKLIDEVRLNRVNEKVLVAARTDKLQGGIYLYANGQLTAVAAPGQALPDGAKCSGYSLAAQVSRSNAAGQLCFITTRTDGSTAAYRLEPDGGLSLVLKSGTLAGTSRIDQVGTSQGMADGVAINGKGQVAVTALVNKRDAILLLTPASP
jgi:hypothetical protein